MINFRTPSLFSLVMYGMLGAGLLLYRIVTVEETWAARIFLIVIAIIIAAVGFWSPQRREHWKGLVIVFVTVFLSLILHRVTGLYFLAASTLLVGVLYGSRLAWTTFVLIGVSHVHLSFEMLLFQWLLASVAILASSRIRVAKDLLVFSIIQALSGSVVYWFMTIFDTIQPGTMHVLEIGLIHGLSMLGIYVLAIFLAQEWTRTALPLNLLSLLSPDSTILSSLATKAPGTYQHSLLVGVMAEEAARKIGNVDLLLVRTGGLVHDIGKLTQPHEYTENQIRNQELLTPEKARRLVLPHPHVGAIRARRAHLPEELEAIIASHLGTSITSAYYHLSRKEQAINQSQYRYPGPKPKTREQALVMLADSVEAAARSRISRSQGENMESFCTTVVDDVIGDRVSDGQLDEVHLTRHEIETIKKSFIQTLMFEFHTRIEWRERSMTKI